jgi:hypothetical protein
VQNAKRGQEDLVKLLVAVGQNIGPIKVIVVITVSVAFFVPR